MSKLHDCEERPRREKQIDQRLEHPALSFRRANQELISRFLWIKRGIVWLAGKRLDSFGWMLKGEYRCWSSV